MKNAGRIVALTAFIVVFLGMGVSNFLLRKQLNIAQQQLRVRQVSTQSGGGVLHVGDAVPPFVVRDRTGRAVNLGGTSTHEWLLVLVHPKCEYCRQVLRDVAQDAATSAVSPSTMSSVAVVSVASLPLSAEITQTLPANVPAYFADKGSRLPVSGAVKVVPQIVRVGGDGKVAAICTSFDQCAADLQRHCSSCTL
jgi:hypothetical protein